MAFDAQARLNEIDTAIDEVLALIASGTEQAYTFRGKSIERASFPALLKQLEASRATYQRMVKSSRGRFGLLKLSRPSR